MPHVEDVGLYSHRLQMTKTQSPHPKKIKDINF